MLQPRFAVWPWAVCAMLVPLLSYLAGYLTIRQGSGHLATLTFLSLYLVADGMLLGIAIGDLGRTVLAMLVGGASAACLAPFCEGPLFVTCFLVMFALLTSCFALAPTGRSILNAACVGLACILAGMLPWLIFVADLGWVSVEGGLYPLPDNSNRFQTHIPVHWALPITNLIFVAGVFRFAFRVPGPAPTQRRA